jgi:uncharacterized protein (TIGR02594 family)
MTLYELASKFSGLAEIAGEKHNGFIQWAHSLCGMDPDAPDEIPWCSSFINALAWILSLPRSGSAAARSWLDVGETVQLSDARFGDVVIFKRGPEPQPGADITRGAPGHVGLFAGLHNGQVLVLGGNQNNRVSHAYYPAKALLGVRRLRA